MPASFTQVRRIARFVLLLLLAGQLAFLTHAVAADHEAGKVCEICVSIERLADGLLESADTLVLSLGFVFAATLAVSLNDKQCLRVVRSRGPPHS